MTKRRGILLAFLFFSAFSLLKAQYSLSDTFRFYLKEKPSLYVSLDGRNSFVRDAPAIIDGVRFGLNYGGKIRLLAGIYDLRFPIFRTYTHAPGTPQEEVRVQRNSFYYFGLTLDYVLYNQGRWKLMLPVQTGYGFGSRQERTPFGDLRLDRELTFMPLELSFSASFRILPWLSAGAGLGYRYALFSNNISDDFSAPIYTYGLGIDVEWFWDRYLKKQILEP